jgi:hypothetical protein
LCGPKPPDQRIGMDVVGEDALAVDLDDREPLAIRRLQLRVAADVDLLQLERMLRTNGSEHLAGPLAEVAPRRGEERDANAYG